MVWDWACLWSWFPTTRSWTITRMNLPRNSKSKAMPHDRVPSKQVFFSEFQVSWALSLFCFRSLTDTKERVLAKAIKIACYKEDKPWVGQNSSVAPVVDEVLGYEADVRARLDWLFCLLLWVNALDVALNGVCASRHIKMEDTRLPALWTLGMEIFASNSLSCPSIFWIISPHCYWSSFSQVRKIWVSFQALKRWDFNKSRFRPLKKRRKRPSRTEY